jgi:valyl-tRNA synthetase
MQASEPLPKTYSPAEVEGPVSRLWLDRGAFNAQPDGRARERRYVIMMPLPNVTGALHMGHAMDNVMQDLLIRWHRMRGDNTLWMPGTDHAGIATQAVVEKRLKELEGLTRYDVGRDGLVDRIWRWKDQYQERIVAQQRRMGCSCDWRRQRFTMDPVCARAVREWFFRLFRDGLILRGKRLVNWDPFLQTSISDDEVYHEAVQGHFWHLRYPVVDPAPGEPDYVEVGTTRPETMLGDTAVAVHPDPAGFIDERIAGVKASIPAASDRERAALEEELTELERRREDLLPRLLRLRDMARAGREVTLPLVERRIPVICDEWAKPDLGSGCVKITPAHDHNDYDVWTRHSDTIGIINILNPDGTLNENAGAYAGMDRYAARDRVVHDLETRGLLGTIEEHEVEIGHSDRSKTPIEPFLSDQWFIRMGDVPDGIVMGRGTPREFRSPGLVQSAMDAVLDDRVGIYPERYAKTYLDWLSEKRDWPISRQLWWGHRIPVWSREAAWSEIRMTDLPRLRAEGVAVRIHRGDEPWSPGVGGSVLPEDGAFGADEMVRADVCLLEDDELVSMLEDLGYCRDPDVLDTWFSSALWPLSTLGWPDPSSAPVGAGQAPLAAEGDSPDCLEYYYPGSCLITGRDIISLWVARMVIAGLHCWGDVPFTDVFIHANILDGKGERMSKSKGNGIDPVDIIEAYGTDAMRYVLCDMQTGTQDIRLPVAAVCPACGHHNDLADTAHGSSIFTYVCGRDSSGKQRQGACGSEFDVLGTMPDLPSATLISERFETGQAFCTKLWNSARFAFMNLEDVMVRDDTPAELALEDRWILARLDEAVGGVNAGLAIYNPSVALAAARDFFWGSLCDWYLELIKPRLQSPADASARVARQVLAFALDQVLRLFHPFVPFITEHLWLLLGERVSKRGLGDLAAAPASDLLVTALWPAQNPRLEDDRLSRVFSEAQEITRAVREVRATHDVPLSREVDVCVERAPGDTPMLEALLRTLLSRLANVRGLDVVPDARRHPGSATAMVGERHVFVRDVCDDAAERERLRKALAKVEQGIASCEKRLANPNFTTRAPAEVVEEHRTRLAGYRATRDEIRRSLEELG